MEEHLLETPAPRSFDFPVLSVAAAARLSRDNVVEDARIVVARQPAVRWPPRRPQNRCWAAP